MKKFKIRAFTLIELLVVISIIGIIAGIIFSVSTSSQKQAYDTQRKSDLKQYQTALEAYAARSSGVYIADVAPPGEDLSSLCGTLGIITACVDDPKAPTNKYRYLSDTTGSGYVLWATLESASNLYWVVCSNGKSGVSSTVPASLTCPI